MLCGDKTHHEDNSELSDHGRRSIRIPSEYNLLCAVTTTRGPLFLFHTIPGRDVRTPGLIQAPGYASVLNTTS